MKNTFASVVRKSSDRWWLAVSVALTLAAAILPTHDLRAQVRPPDRLSIVQFCNEQGFKCQLRFIDSHKGEDVAALARAYIARSGDTSLGPRVTVQAECSPGWIASVTAQEGTISSGGVVNASATVCGNADPTSALRTALRSCDAGSADVCKNANHIRAVWGKWDGVTASRRLLEPGRPYDPLSYPDGQQCSSTVPVYPTSTCLPDAVRQLKEAGVN